MDLGQVFTRECVAKFMISLFDGIQQGKILDPCVGDGVFLDAAIEAGYENMEGYELDKKLYNQVREKYSTLNLLNQDFLLSHHKNKYDGIIMNPPYIRHEKIDELSEYGITKALLQRKKTFRKLPNSANLYMYFILEAVDLLKENGQLVVIFPSSWLNTRTGKSFEKVLFKKCFLAEQDFISGDVFETSALVEVIIMKLVKTGERSNTIMRHYKVEEDSLKEYKEEKDFGTVGLTVPFEKLAQIRRGLTTGWNSAFINPPIEHRTNKLYREIVSSPKAISGYCTLNARTDLLFMANEDDSLSRQEKEYIHNLELNLERTHKPKTLYQSMKAGRCWYKLNPIDSRGIWFGYFVRNDMKFIYNDTELIARDNFYIIYPKIDCCLAFALFNNLYTFYQLEHKGKKYGAGLLKLQRYDLEGIMLPDISLFMEKDCVRLKAIAEQLILSGDKNCVLEITKVISKYTSVGYEEIVDKYNRIKEQRLKNKT